MTPRGACVTIAPQRGVVPSMDVKLDRNECIGCGVCVQICPEVFELDEEAGKARVAHQGVASETVREALESCSVGCISVEGKKESA